MGQLEFSVELQRGVQRCLPLRSLVTDAPHQPQPQPRLWLDSSAHPGTPLSRPPRFKRVVSIGSIDCQTLYKVYFGYI